MNIIIIIISFLIGYGTNYIVNLINDIINNNKKLHDDTNEKKFIKNDHNQVCIHEAGHAVMLKYFDYDIKNVKFTYDDYNKLIGGEAVYTRYNLTASHEKDIMILFGGIVAEMIFFNRSNPINSKSDLSCIKEIVISLSHNNYLHHMSYNKSDGFDPSSFFKYNFSDIEKNILYTLYHKTKDIIKANRNKTYRIAIKLSEDKNIDSKGINKIWHE